MNPRNMLRNNSTIEFEVARQIPNQQHPEPYIILGSPPNFPQSNAHQILPSGSLNNIDFHRLPEDQDATALYRLPHYPHPVHPVGSLEPGIPTPSNFYNPYMNPAPGGMMFSGPLNPSSMDQLPSSSSFGASSSHVSGYGMNGFASDGFQGLSKRNGPEGFMGNAQYFNSPSAPAVSAPPMNVCHIDAACNPMPQFRGNYVGPSFQPPGVTWCERQPNGVGDRSSLSPFNYPPISPYFEVSNVNGNSSEIGNTGPQRFHEGASTSQGSLNLLPYTPMLHPPPNIHPQNIQAGSRYNLNYPPPIATTSSRHPVNNMQYAGISHPQQVPEAVPPPPGIRIYRSHRRSGAPEGVHRHRNFPHLRLLQEEGVAILEFAGHHEMSSAIDHHRDMRLDIDYMSYEELLALSEQIGDVNTGLSEAAINAHLKTRIYISSCGTINLEELPCIDDKKDSCVICQDEYEENDNIGTLDCSHEYHVDCLKKWLLVKNACPICKSAALNVEHKKSG